MRRRTEQLWRIVMEKRTSMFRQTPWRGAVAGVEAAAGGETHCRGAARAVEWRGLRPLPLAATAS